MNKIILVVVIIASFLSACKNKTMEQGHEHEHGPDPLSFTLYSDKLELFVEFPPLVVGNTSKFATHITILGEKFQPLSEGQVSISLIVGEKGIKQLVDTPSVPGIFPLALKPVVSGDGKLVFDITTKSFTDKFIIDNVKIYADEKSVAENAGESASSDISFSKEQAWKIDFANAPVKKHVFSDVIKTSGQILSAPGDEMMVTAQASGLVKFAGNKTIIGSKLNKGVSLFIITGGDLTVDNLDADIKQSKAKYNQAKMNYERASELVKDKLISQKDFLQAQADFENARTEYNAVSKNYSSKGQSILSPMDGFVKSILVSEGQFVEAGTPLATISKNRKLILQANVSQKHFGKLSTITSANFKPAGNAQVFSTHELNGKIISFGKSTSAQSPFIPVTFEIDNKEQLIPGSVVEVYLKSIPIPDAMVIPVSSLIEEQGNIFVYVQTKGESFQKREVKIGASDGMNVQLLSGVAEGERVVTKGAYQIKLASASGALPAHGHEH